MGTNNISKERYIYLDFIKVLAIYFVCFYHYNNLNIDYLSNSSYSTYFSYYIKGIATIGVPLFFMVNGALMLNRDYDLKKHIKKIINIILLTVIWGVITLIILIPIRGNSYSLVQFFKALWSWEIPTINHLWFLQTLVGIYILYPLIKEVYDKKETKVLTYTISVIFIFTFGNVILNIIANILESILGINYLTSNDVNFFNNFNIFRGFHAYSIVYFIIGGLLLKKLNTGIKLNASHFIIIFIVSMTLLFLYGIMMSYSNLKIYDIVWNGYNEVVR